MKDKEGRIAFHVAAYYGNLHNMEAIIKFCPDCAEIVDNKGRNALHYGVNAEQRFVVGKMMQNISLSGLYNEKDNDGNTPLHHLAYSRLQSWELMFHRRIDKLALNQKDETPLDIAYATVEYSPLQKKVNMSTDVGIFCQ
ncbi:Ankyrin repeat-containing protein [Arachis hypogaea]|nr:Ankyrin repeat-containing protein [Arachis hypogaea]